MLTPEQLAAREGKFTASRADILMNGTEAEVLNLWRGMVGHPAYVEEDLSGNWAVQLGSATEQLNLDWYARKHGAVSRRGEVIVNHKIDWMACTLDGWSDKHNCPIECKHVGGRETEETVRDRYQPQMQWQMLVTTATKCAFSIIAGASEPVVDFIPFDRPYADELLKRATQFMRHVELMTPPVVLPAVAPPVIPTREVDMDGNNAWANEAAAWKDNWAAGKEAERAAKAIKGMVPADVKMAYGHGIVVTRNRAGSMSLREAGAKL